MPVHRRFALRRLRHRERVMREVNFLIVFVPLIHRVIHNPAKFKRAFGYEVEVSGNFVPRRACELIGIAFFTRREEHAVASLKAHLIEERFEEVWVKVFKCRVLGDYRAVFFAQTRITEARRLHFFLGPFVEAVEELTALAVRRAWRRNSDDLAAAARDFSEDTKACFALIFKEFRHITRKSRAPSGELAVSIGV